MPAGSTCGHSLIVQDRAGQPPEEQQDVEYPHMSLAAKVLWGTRGPEVTPIPHPPTTDRPLLSAELVRPRPPVQTGERLDFEW